MNDKNKKMDPETLAKILQRISELNTVNPTINNKTKVNVNNEVLNKLRNYIKNAELKNSNPLTLKEYLTSNDPKNSLKEDKIQRLQIEIRNLEKKSNSILRMLNEKDLNQQKVTDDLALLQENITQIEKKSELAYLTNKINLKASEYLFNHPEFAENFSESNIGKCIVLSIDIRRSTELMLKAKSPQSFTTFISKLSEDLKSIIIENFGIFDKFTGDGILAFFPDFYSGNQGLIYALKAAELCHQKFKEIYQECRNCFVTVLKETGLGIGIDYGPATFARINGELTVVGVPVVYACRLSSTVANTTLCNQSVLDELYERKIEFKHNEKEIEIKHEGNIVAYEIIIDWTTTEILSPEWK